METAEGKTIFAQNVYGRLRFFRRHIPELLINSQLDCESEVARFSKAQHQAVLQLAGFYDRASRRVETETASIFAIHAMLLEDEDFVETVEAMIRQRGTTAEYAVQVAGTNFAAAFSAMDDPYMRARAADIRDISGRVLQLLMGTKWDNPLDDGPAILVADEFFPSEVMMLDHRLLLGLVSRKGSVDSHTAILERAYSIPAMAEVKLEPFWDGHMALLSGVEQRLYLDPEQSFLETVGVTVQQAVQVRK